MYCFFKEIFDSTTVINLHGHIFLQLILYNQKRWSHIDNIIEVSLLMKSCPLSVSFYLSVLKGQKGWIEDKRKEGCRGGVPAGPLHVCKKSRLKLRIEIVIVSKVWDKGCHCKSGLLLIGAYVVFVVYQGNFLTLRHTSCSNPKESAILNLSTLSQQYLQSSILISLIQTTPSNHSLSTNNPHLYPRVNAWV